MFVLSPSSHPPTATHPPPPPPTHPLLALPDLRDQFPSWFQSQLGNKVWYTGIGTPEVVRRSCAALHTKVKVCVGEGGVKKSMEKEEGGGGGCSTVYEDMMNVCRG